MQLGFIHHVGIAVPSIEKSLTFHTKVLGMEQISDIVLDENQQVKVVLLDPQPKAEKEHALVELVESVGASTVDQILKQKNHLYHYCMEVDNLEEVLQTVRKEHAIVVLPPTPAALFNGRKIAFIWTPDHYLIEFLEKE
ncbi:MAG: VOC family protein [Asgard group archaeon]|nr:VOC family protein [Asgard group archaeon]